MNFAQMREMFLDYMDDPRAQSWDENKVARFINRGVEHITNVMRANNRNDFVAATDFAITSDSSNDFRQALPADFLQVNHVERILGETRVPMASVSFGNRDGAGGARLQGAKGAQGSDLYFIHGTEFGVARPSGTYTARLWYIQAPTELGDDADTLPEVPSDLHNAVVLYGVRLAKPSFLKADGFRDVYNEEMAKGRSVAVRRAGEPTHTGIDPHAAF